MRAALAGAALLAACGGGASKPSPYTHHDPAFTLDGQDIVTAVTPNRG